MYGHRIHAFCFMRNHIHLLIQIGNIPLGEVMHNLEMRYSRRINKKYGKMGHLFQGRYKSILIQDGIYFIRLLRYIHRNPIRAGIVTSLEDYQWSSHNSYIQQSLISWITTDFGLSKFKNNQFGELSEYTRFVSEIEDKDELMELRANFKDGYVFGDADFINSIKSENGIQKNNLLTIIEIIDSVCDALKIKKELIPSKDKSRNITFARGIICKIGVDKAGLSKTALGRFLNRDQSTISRLIENCETKHKKYADEFPNLELLKNLASIID